MCLFCSMLFYALGWKKNWKYFCIVSWIVFNVDDKVFRPTFFHIVRRYTCTNRMAFSKSASLLIMERVQKWNMNVAWMPMKGILYWKCQISLLRPFIIQITKCLLLFALIKTSKYKIRWKWNNSFKYFHVNYSKNAHNNLWKNVTVCHKRISIYIKQKYFYKKMKWNVMKIFHSAY